MDRVNVVTRTVCKHPHKYQQQLRPLQLQGTRTADFSAHICTDNSTVQWRRETGAKGGGVTRACAPGGTFQWGRHFKEDKKFGRRIRSFKLFTALYNRPSEMFFDD